MCTSSRGRPPMALRYSAQISSVGRPLRSGATGSAGAPAALERAGSAVAGLGASLRALAPLAALGLGAFAADAPFPARLAAGRALWTGLLPDGVDFFWLIDGGAGWGREQPQYLTSEWTGSSERRFR